MSSDRFCVSEINYLLNTAGLLLVRRQLLPQLIVLHHQQLHLAGFLQAGRGKAAEGAVARDFCRLVRLDIPSKKKPFK